MAYVTVFLLYQCMNYAFALVECASTEKYAEGLETCCGVALNNNALGTANWHGLVPVPQRPGNPLQTLTNSWTRGAIPLLQ